MTDKFIFWAQALDNASPDHFDVYGNNLAPDDTVQRQEAVSMVSSVIKNGTRLFDKNSVLLTADASHFVLEVQSVQRDLAGRNAPIVCCGDYETITGNALGSSAVIALENFAKKIGRSLQPEYYQLVLASFDALKKKSLKRKGKGIVWTITVVLALLVIVYYLVRNSW